MVYLKVTFYKRKKGLLKKAMEISILCGVKVFMFINDLKETKMVQYQSEKNDNVMQVLKKSVCKELFTNNDVSP